LDDPRATLAMMRSVRKMLMNCTHCFSRNHQASELTAKARAEIDLLDRWISNLDFDDL